jgi:undecaprenyl diphosphate synthase
MPLFKRKKQMGNERSPRILPKHIGIIMDGNGRWAKQRGLPRQAGHSVGARAFRTITRYCNQIGVPYLTVYAFSTENWKRPKEEVDGIMNLFRDYLKEALADFQDENIRTRFIGDTSVLADDIRELIRQAEESTRDATGMTLNIAINYGGRQEILLAAKRLLEDASRGLVTAGTLTQADLESRLYTAGQPDPDMIIRPSGEERLSNFLLWQSAYAEYVFSDILWPDFSPRNLEDAIDEFNRRSRRFGGV